ncbi:hypothetical protein, partial [Faecalibacterium prausnitzii]|uniref:hypothetical protein n=1 Tax=Faecalibacterium prausnitzii TaxID=853 RepID=UPI00291167FB
LRDSPNKTTPLPPPVQNAGGGKGQKKERGFFHEKSNEETHGCAAGSCYGLRHGDPGVCSWYWQQHAYDQW